MLRVPRTPGVHRDCRRDGDVETVDSPVDGQLDLQIGLLDERSGQPVALVAGDDQRTLGPVGLPHELRIGALLQGHDAVTLGARPLEAGPRRGQHLDRQPPIRALRRGPVVEVAPHDPERLRSGGVGAANQRAEIHAVGEVEGGDREGPRPDRRRRLRGRQPEGADVREAGVAHVGAATRDRVERAPGAMADRGIRVLDEALEQRLCGRADGAERDAGRAPRTLVAAGEHRRQLPADFVRVEPREQVHRATAHPALRREQRGQQRRDRLVGRRDLQRDPRLAAQEAVVGGERHPRRVLHPPGIAPLRSRAHGEPLRVGVRVVGREVGCDVELVSHT